MEIRIHSFTDLITNSSTTIFTYSDNSLEACKEMIDEFFQALGVDKTCDDVFNLVVTLDDESSYADCLEDEDNEDEDEEDDEDDEEEDDDGSAVDANNIEEIVKDVRAGKIAKPQWMVEAEEYAKNMDEPPETTLFISAKSPEFEKLAKLVKNFLYSTEQEASYG